MTILHKIYLLRHGEPEITGTYLGSTDVGLSNNGYLQLSSVASLFADISFSTIFCSPMKRCLQTLHTVKSIADFRQMADLKEIDFGAWETKTFEEIASVYANEITSWAENEGDFCFPEAESVNLFRRRIERAYQSIIDPAHSPVLIVSHGGVIRHLLCLFLDLPMSNHHLFRLDYGHLATIETFDGGSVLTALNRQ